MIRRSICIALFLCLVLTSTVAAMPTDQGPGTLVVSKWITARYSRYDPALGGTNCAWFVNGICVSRMASGKPWAPYMEMACACPREWPFGTTVILDGRRWTCLDRGGKVTYNQGIPWVDFLTRYPTHSYRTLVSAEVIFYDGRLH